MVVEREKDQKSRCFLGAKANGLSGPPLWEVRKVLPAGGCKTGLEGNVFRGRGKPVNWKALCEKGLPVPTVPPTQECHHGSAFMSSERCQFVTTVVTNWHRTRRT